VDFFDLSGFVLINNLLIIDIDIPLLLLILNLEPQRPPIPIFILRHIFPPPRSRPAPSSSGYHHHPSDPLPSSAWWEWRVVYSSAAGVVDRVGDEESEERKWGTRS